MTSTRKGREVCVNPMGGGRGGKRRDVDNHDTVVVVVVVVVVASIIIGIAHLATPSERKTVSLSKNILEN